MNLPVGIHTTTCRKCNFTCHNDCPYSDDRSKANCCAMSRGYCTVCPNRCHRFDHSNIRYCNDYYTEKVAKAYYAQKEIYEKAVSRKRHVVWSLVEKQQQLDAHQKDVNSLTKQAQESNKRLGCIALKPNTLAETNCLIFLLLLKKPRSNLDGKKESSSTMSYLKEPSSEEIGNQRSQNEME